MSVVEVVDVRRSAPDDAPLAQGAIKALREEREARKAAEWPVRSQG